MTKFYFATGFLLFSVAMMAQNTCAEALVIEAGTHSVDTVDGPEAPTPDCIFIEAPANHGEWYKYQPADTFNLLITTSLPGSVGIDTRLHLYIGQCGDLTCVAGDDDGGTGTNSLLELDVFPENEYYIAFDDKYSSAAFDFVLIENEYIEPLPQLFSFTPQNIDISGTMRGAVDMTGDFLDDLVAVEVQSVSVGVQNEASIAVSSFPTNPAIYFPSWSMAAGDVDGNGWNDLVYGGASGASIMFRAEDGESFDEQITSDIYIFSQRSNMVDIDNDGNLDVFVCHDVEPNTYFMNNGDGTMQLIQGGLGDDATGGNYGSIWTDYDNDGDIDMFIAKCRGGSNTININEMHRNNGDGTYTEVADEIGLADPLQTWSSAWGDYDNDGDLDVFVGASSFSDGSHKLMVNNGDGTFSNATLGSGLEMLASLSVEWVTHDFDNDGYLDIMGGSGNILRNNGDFTFTPTEVDFWNGPIGDLNNDGFLDVVNDNTIYYNDGNENNYLVINAVGVESNSNGIGARITVYSESFSQIREIRSGDGFRFMSSLNAYFGLGTDAEVDSVVMQWPSGIVDIITEPEINSSLLITEGMTTLSVENEIEASLLVYPNPAINELFIDSPESIRGNRFEIFDVQGKSAQSGVLNSNTVDVSTLGTGNYIFQIWFGNENVETKFFKK